MGIIEGGITGNVSGKVAGVVFSETRGRTGKVNTVRQKVRPSNPRSPRQVLQRTKLEDSVVIVRALSASAHKFDWGGAIGQLAGFQSFTSLLIRAMTDQLNVAAIPAAQADRTPTPATYFKNVAARSEAAGTIADLTSGDSYVLVAWAQNADENLFAPTTSFTLAAASQQRTRKAS